MVTEAKRIKRRQKKQQKRLMRRLAGQGDYDVIEATPRVVKKPNPIASLESRVAKLESNTGKSVTPIGKLASSAGKFIGDKFGYGNLGEQAGGMMARLFGHGDYDVRVNSLMQGSKDPSGERGSNMVPKFQNDGRGVRIKEREYIGDITASAAQGLFNNQSFPINPGLSSTFPWLSTVAGQFEEYEFMGLVFEYISTSSEFNGSSQALGSVTMATDYDPTDPPYVNLIQMQSSDYSCMVKASKSMEHGIECDPTERPSRVSFVRTGNVSDDLKFYDLGLFQVATQGMSVANVDVGQLWVSYDVMLKKKQLIAGQLGTTIGESSLVFTNPTSAVPFGTGNTSYYDNIGVAWAGNVVNFPTSLQAGAYALFYQNDNTATDYYTITATNTNCSTYANTGGYYGFPFEDLNSSNTATELHSVIIVLNGIGAKSSWAFTVGAGLNTAGVFMQQLNLNSVNALIAAGKISATTTF